MERAAVTHRERHAVNAPDHRFELPLGELVFQQTTQLWGRASRRPTQTRSWPSQLFKLAITACMRKLLNAMLKSPQLCRQEPIDA